jgi:DNA-binding CsgD family transcriptional regulator/tetratricopeptide (TPR) repeat protein
MIEGRAREQARLRALLGRVRSHRSAGLVLRGEAGIGKTALLRWTCDEARDLGFHCLSAVGLEAGAAQPYEAVAELLLTLRPRLAELDETGILAELFATETAAVSPRLVAAALLQVVATLEGERPVLLCVDDAQWVDPSSERVVSLLARQVADERVALVVASRRPPAWARGAGLEELRLTGLEEAEGVRLLQREAGLDEEDARECWRSTGGNPLAMRELGPGWSPGHLEANPEALPSQLADALDERLSALPSTDRQALLLVALGRTTDPRLLGAALPDTAGFLQRATAAGLVEEHDGRLDFTHPLLRTRVLAASGVEDVRSAHAALAGAAEQTGNPVAGTWHRAAALRGPDEQVAAQLSATADAYRRRGAATEALAASELAARLSPDALARAHRTVDAADMAWFTGDFDRAEALLAQADAETDDVEVRARRAVILGQLRVWSRGPMDAYRLLVTEAEALLSHAPAGAATCLSHAAFAALVAVRMDLALDAAERAVAVREHDDVGAQMGAQTAHALALLAMGRGAEADALMEPIEAMGRALAESGMTEAEHLVQSAALAHAYRGRGDRARDLLTGILQRGRSAGARDATAFATGILAEVCVRSGRLVEGYGLVTDVLAEEWGGPGDRAWSHAFLAHACAALGREQECRTEATLALRVAEPLGLTVVTAWAEASLGLLELGAGRPDRSLLHLDRLAGIWDRGRVGEPGLLWWEGDHLDALVASGRTEDARSRLRRLSEETAATGSAYGRAAAARGEALLADQGREADAWAAAIEAAEALGSPFETARALLGRSEATSRQDPCSSASDRRRAREMFEGLGARCWADLAAEPDRAEDTVPASSPSALDQLTPAELRVAMAVSRGLTNKEASLDLCISTKTVDSHLQRIFRKLEVRTRTEMAARLLR